MSGDRKTCKYLELRFDLQKDEFRGKCEVHGSIVTRTTGQGWPVYCREPDGERRRVDNGQQLPMRPMR